MRNISSITSSTLGNILEWYDFGLFTIFSSLFSELFFPTENPKTALIATFGIFAAGFLCRPIGALIFGYLGDKTGRASTLRLSILMISLPTLFIGFLPTYQQIGMLAPVLLMLIRMWQGISIGGEYSGNLVYLAEIAPSDFRATFTSLASMGSNLGILLAAIVGILCTTLLSENTLRVWGWRAPYLISGLLSILIYAFRLNIRETPIFNRLKEKKRITKNPIKTVFEKESRPLLLSLGLVCMGSTFYYFCFIYLPIYLKQTLNFSLEYISFLITFFICAMIALVPIGGLICDKVGRRKMLLFNAALISVSIIPGFYFLQYGSFLLIVIILAIFTMGSSFEQGTTPIAVIENFPPPARYTGVSLGYNLGNGFLGGTVAFICEWLVSESSIPLAPAFYITFYALITLFVVFFFVAETKGKSLSS